MTTEKELFEKVVAELGDAVPQEAKEIADHYFAGDLSRHNAKSALRKLHHTMFGHMSAREQAFDVKNQVFSMIAVIVEGSLSTSDKEDIIEELGEIKEDLNA